MINEMVLSCISFCIRINGEKGSFEMSLKIPRKIEKSKKSTFYLKRTEEEKKIIWKKIFDKSIKKSLEWLLKKDKKNHEKIP